MTALIRRTMSAAALNAIAELPEVRPFLLSAEAAERAGALDLGPLLANPQNFAIEAVDPADGEVLGGWVFAWKLPGVFELHTLFKPEHRGARFFQAWDEARRFMFAHTDALEIVTYCPDNNPGARLAAGRAGFRERFRREDAWGPGIGLSYRVFSVDDWFVRDNACLLAGAAFHLALEEAKAREGSALPVHPDDHTHDRAVGAAVLMARGGFLGKGVGFYNRFAVLAGYAEVAAVGVDVVDVRDAIVQVLPEGFRVLLCR